MLIAPIKNENGSIMMYIVNLEDVTSSPDLVDVNMGKYLSPLFYLLTDRGFAFSDVSYVLRVVGL